MNIFKKLFNREPIIIEKAGSDLVYVSGSNFNYNIPSLTLKEQRDYYQGLVASCIDFRANSIKKGYGILYNYTNQTDTPELNSHLFIDLMRKPNSFYSFSKLLEYTAKSLDIYGNAYWYIPKTRLGQPYEIYSLPADEMQVLIDSNGTPIGYERIIETIPNNINKVIKYNADEIIHYKTYNPNSVYYGLGIIQKAAIAIGIDLNLGQYQSNLLKNDAVPKGYIEGGRRVSQEDLERLQEHHSKKYAGVSNAGKMQFLFEGMKYNQLQSTPKDLDFIESKKFTRQEILDTFQVPSSALGTGDSTNKSTAAINIQTFYHNVITPILSDIGDQLSLFIKQSYKDNNIFIKFILPLPKDREMELKENDMMIRYGVISLNEARTFYKYDMKPEYEKPYTVNNNPIKTDTNPQKPIV